MNADSYGHSLSEFDSLLSFFLRRKDFSTKMRTQRLVDGLTSPAESTITFLGKLSHNDTMPIKGAGFTVAKLLGKPAPEYLSGCVFYLSPGNYHYVHAPCDMTVEAYYELPGKLRSVAPALLKDHPNLFGENLRHVILGKTKENVSIAVVLVGAKNVGEIACPKLEGFEEGQVVEYTKGEMMGYFSIGSTVVLLLGTEPDWRETSEGDTIDVLDPLCQINEDI